MAHGTLEGKQMSKSWKDLSKKEKSLVRKMKEGVIASHDEMLETAGDYFRLQGFKIFTTQNKIPDMVVTNKDGLFYAIEVLTQPDVDTIKKKIDKYQSEDIDGIYFIIPHRRVFEFSNIFSKQPVCFLSFERMNGELFTVIERHEKWKKEKE